MPIKIIDTQSGSPLKIWTDKVEDEALKQLRNTGAMPFIFKHVAVMPDVHMGIGSTVGSVVATKGAIMPSCVGVDIGCGMSALKLEGIAPRDLEGHLPRIRAAIESHVPVGFNVHGGEEGIKALSGHAYKNILDPLLSGQKKILEKAREEKTPWLEKGLRKTASQIGTLGGGNHFIEICLSKKDDLSDEDEVWLMLHTGSRGVGGSIGQHHINKAKGIMSDALIDLPDMDLAYLTEHSKAFDSYISDMRWAQEFAYANRRAIQEILLKVIYGELAIRRPLSPQPFIDCHHNYVAEERHYGENVFVTRKGAVRAGLGEMGIIPGSMGARSFIVKGLGNEESFCSCSHGAGRVMSRSKAKAHFTQEDLAQQTQGIECRKDKDVIDEIPGAYKNIDEVMAHQSDLVSIERILRQVICVKG